MRFATGGCLPRPWDSPRQARPRALPPPKVTEPPSQRMSNREHMARPCDLDTNSSCDLGQQSAMFGLWKLLPSKAVAQMDRGMPDHLQKAHGRIRRKEEQNHPRSGPSQCTDWPSPRGTQISGLHAHLPHRLAAHAALSAQWPRPLEGRGRKQEGENRPKKLWQPAECPGAGNRHRAPPRPRPNDSAYFRTTPKHQELSMD